MRSIQDILMSNLVYYRKRCKMTQADVAKAIGVSRQTVWNYETDKNINPPYEKLADLAEIYGCTVPELLSSKNFDKAENHPVVCVPIIKDVNAKNIFDASNIIGSKLFAVEELEDSNEYFCLVADFPGMQPYIEKGDILLIEKKVIAPNNSYIIATLKSTTGAFIYKDLTTHVTLESQNPYYPKIDIDSNQKYMVKIKGIIKKVIREI